MTDRDRFEKWRDKGADEFQIKEMVDITQIISLNHGFKAGANATHDLLMPLVDELKEALEIWIDKAPTWDEEQGQTIKTLASVRHKLENLGGG